MKNRRISLLVLALVLPIVLLSCNNQQNDIKSQDETEQKETEQKETEKKDEEKDYRIFVDDAGREVKIPNEIKRIIPSGDLSNAFMWPIAKDRLVSLSSKFTERKKKYLGEKYASLPITGNIYKAGSEFNVEQAASLKPDLIIDYGEKKENVLKDLDELQELLGVPVVFIEGTFDAPYRSYRRLGELLSEEEKAEKLAVYLENIMKKSSEFLKNNEKKSFVTLNSSKALGCVAKGTFIDDVWSYMGNNLAEVSESQEYSATFIDIEQLLNWNPEFIFMYNMKSPEEMVEMKIWNKLKAVQNGNVFKVPYGAYNYTSLYNANRALGILWLSEKLYPNQIDWSYDDLHTEYYKLFYDYDLSEEEKEFFRK